MKETYRILTESIHCINKKVTFHFRKINCIYSWVYWQFSPATIMAERECSFTVDFARCWYVSWWRFAAGYWRYTTKLFHFRSAFLIFFAKFFPVKFIWIFHHEIVAEFVHEFIAMERIEKRDDERLRVRISSCMHYTDEFLEFTFWKFLIIVICFN